MKIRKFVCNPFLENSFIVWDEITCESMIIDPGCLDSREEKVIQEFIRMNKLTVKYLVNTHCHLDHIFGNHFIKQTFPGAVFLAPEGDLPLLKNSREQAKRFGVSFSDSPMPDVYMTEETVIELGSEKFTCLFTPGHTPGEYCLLNAANKVCFTGDVLFKESIGRTDLWGGNLQALETSIRSKLFVLDDEIIIHPGHGESSTIGYEKMNNPFFY